MYISCDCTGIACIVSEIVLSIVDAHSGYDGWWQWYNNGKPKGRLPCFDTIVIKSVLKPVWWL